MDTIDLRMSGLLDTEERPAGQLKALAEGDILGAVTQAVKSAGLAGETYSIKLLYLAMTSRLLDRPIHAVVKAPSASGKSYLINTVSKLFDESTYYGLTSASPKVLFRPNLNLKHRVLIIQEAIWSRELDYVLRTLLSEGRLEYPTVQGGEAIVLKNDGPVAFVTSTTRWELDPELETRLYTIPLSTKPEQTRAILLATANPQKMQETEQTSLLRTWQGWLQDYSAHTADIPFAAKLAELVPTENIRVRRDFAQLLALIRAHAILYQAQRKADPETGVPVAIPADYAQVYELLAGVRGQTDAGAKVAWQSDVMAAVKVLGQHNGNNGECTLNALASELDWALSTTHRRVQALLKAGHLGQKGSGQGSEARLHIRAELGSDWLPHPRSLTARRKVKA